MDETIKKMTYVSRKDNTDVFRAGIPAEWAKDMGITSEDRNMILYFDEDKSEITIEKNPLSVEELDAKIKDEQITAELEAIKKAQAKIAKILSESEE